MKFEQSKARQRHLKNWDSVLEKRRSSKGQNYRETLGDNTTGEQHALNLLVCPRCRYQLAIQLPAESIWLTCSACNFEFTRSDFEIQAKRERQVAAWPNDPSKQILLCDKPMGTTVGPMKMSFGEWVRWKFKAPKTSVDLTLRSAVHQMICSATQLGLIYPAIPRYIRTPSDVTAFWMDPSHRFILDQVESWASDSSHIADVFYRKGQLSKGEIRHIIDSQLPHANWGGVAVTYTPWKPECRSLLLAIGLLEAMGRPLPRILSDIKAWIREDGWDEHGRALDISTKEQA